jgi:hypothetical protein
VIIGHASRQSGRLAALIKVGPPGLPQAAKRVAIAHRTLGPRRATMTRRWNAALQSLVLVRIGQELGCDSPAARALHDLLELLASVAGTLAR